MDLWNFCKVWTLKSCPKALLLICFYWRKGKNGAHVCSASLTAASSCVCRVQRCLGDMEITVPKSGDERGSGHRSSQVTRLWSCNMTEKYVFCYFQFSIKRKSVKKNESRKEPQHSWLLSQCRSQRHGLITVLSSFGNWNVRHLRVKYREEWQACSKPSQMMVRQGLCPSEHLPWTQRVLGTEHLILPSLGYIF